MIEEPQRSFGYFSHAINRITYEPSDNTRSSGKGHVSYSMNAPGERTCSVVHKPLNAHRLKKLRGTRFESGLLTKFHFFT